LWGCGPVGSLLTFDIPQTALVATLDIYDFNQLPIDLRSSIVRLCRKYCQDTTEEGAEDARHAM
jgi:hypothetical protein